VPDFEALILSVNKNIEKLEEELGGTQGQLEGVNKKLDRLPKEYIPRGEAEVKASRIRKVLMVIASAAVILAGGGYWLNSRLVSSCEDSRNGLREVINVAVADRQPLSTSTPETIAAIQEQNERTIRPLREKLLSLNGTQPDKC
jgi:hypothetical protein